ncbi:bacteriohopanetetrol glucosamine biosynthesis glycosyltransferase HpnI [Burkholderia cenocepacia]|uniref:bacteriohopanetetrol glucosamine biosynthesis glycosyltransferase HpnI n=1 Tax=Burkholderia cepacia complex TaxID=87882 RepID=UPI001B942106|nr:MULTISPECIES: bacteriohopanetetrol glucosamine biosynthesis glycosyltransferase HpnI [Burkholderia cepacia complex]MBR8173920.1 bacteriohopanetetrol glucosamine biosynthesis glycosyltransferase HpnI [Burkholderia cenocepacia]MCO8320394.1 bacteriohopanetetrol glucosamine biosynthesis glycosyltransferase HpnI [Burkholderia multivorans]
MVGLCSATSLYALFAALAMPFLGSWKKIRAVAYSNPPSSVSVLKPLCGAEPQLFENLATFCEQDHPCFQLIFGVASAHDTAIAVVHQLQNAYPNRDIDLIVDPRIHGANRKVSNLINMVPHARYDILVLADSDIAVSRDYLRIVTAPVNARAHQVGVVTCLYRARGIAGVWSKLGAMFINAWFAPSVRVAHTLGSRSFGFGSTLAFHKLTLTRIGGFEALKDCLADDFMLAKFARDQGLATVLSPLLVTTDVIEQSLEELWSREIRWLRTIRSVNPAGFASLFITFTVPWQILSVGILEVAHLHPLTMFSASHTALTLLTISTVVGIIARLLIHARGCWGWRDLIFDIPLIPLRDILLALQWLGASIGSHVRWRGTRVPVANPCSK